MADIIYPSLDDGSTTALTLTNLTNTGTGGTGLFGNIAPVTLFPINSQVTTASVKNLIFPGYLNGVAYGAKWGNAVGQGLNITTSFSTANSAYNYANADTANKQAFLPAQITAARAVMSSYAAVSNITFSEVVETSTSAGDIRWNKTNSVTTPTAHGTPPIYSNAEVGDIWLGSNYPMYYDNPVVGQYGYQTLIHELGHVLGLAHPHQSSVAPVANEDQLKYSIMSYRDFAGDALNGYSSRYFPTTPMLNDVAAMQFLYGANMTYHTSDDVYSWDASKSVYETIWDAGGIDTLDASNQAQGVVLNLNSGQWSSIGVAFSNGQVVNGLAVMVRDNLTIAYGAVIENATGSAFNDVLIGNSANNTLNDGAGNDSLDGGLGNDTLNSYSGNDTLIGGVGDDVLNGASNVFKLFYNAATVKIFAGNQLISNVPMPNNVFPTAQAGQSVIFHGNYTDDIVYVTPGSRVDATDLGTGNDKIYLTGNFTDYNASVSGNFYTFQRIINGNIEKLKVISTATITDSLFFADGHIDLNHNNLLGSTGFKPITSSMLLSGGTSTFNTAQLTTLPLSSIPNEADSLVGGLGNDTYSIDSTNDVVVENVNEGTDSVQSAVSYTLPTNVENLTLTDNAVSGTGNVLNNVIVGNQEANTLQGGAGNDSIVGGAGNDFIYDSIGDSSLDGGAGNDSIVYEGSSNVTALGGDGDDELSISWGGTSSISSIDGGNGSDGIYTTGRWGSRNTLIGGNGDDWIQTGLGGNNTILAGSGNDGIYMSQMLSGLSGNQSIDGGDGIDVMNFDYINTPFSINLNGTTSTINGYNFNIVNIEQIAVTDGNNTIVGNDVNNTIWDGTGNSALLGGGGNDSLSGGAGDDVLNGGLGNDSLDGGTGINTIDYSATTQGVAVDLVANTTQSIAFDGTNEIGSDSLLNLQNVLGGSGDDELIGNTSANKLVGNGGYDLLSGGDGDDTLDGSLGSDILVGGTGNDTYVVDSATDTVIEWANQGVDAVNSSISYNLTNRNIENLTLTGSSIINGRGNLANNVLLGNSATNSLIGGAGNDTLDGGLGNDTLNGGLGNDIFKFSMLSGIDTIQDFNSVDDIQLNKGVFTSLVNTGVLALNSFRFGAGLTTAADFDDYLIYNSSTGNLYYDAGGNTVGSATSVQIAVLGVNLAMTNSDFVII